jgi:hydrogenase maturation protein HypF
MELEFAVAAWAEGECYPTPVRTMGEDEPAVVDWAFLIRGVLADLEKGLPPGAISRKVHWSLVEAIVQVAESAGHRRVILTGGCFQNRVLTEHAIAKLRQAGFEPFWHWQVPPNDGGIALGQVLAGQRHLECRSSEHSVAPEVEPGPTQAARH